MDSKIQEEMLYLLRYLDDYIEDAVYKVINDSVDDPQYSAITTSNLIKCYIHVMKFFGEPLPYNDIKSYFCNNLLDSKDYNKFMDSAKLESAYYVGKIYDD